MPEAPEILISYSKVDNDGENSGGGWVDNFKNFLEALLAQMLKTSPSIGLINEDSDHASETYEGSTVLIALLSESFLNKEQLMAGLSNFAKLKSSKDELSINGNPTLYQVLLNPVEVSHLPSLVSELISYNFFEINPKTGIVEPYERFFGSKAGKKFWMKLVDMSYDLSRVLISTNPRYSVHENIRKEDEVIYLAETGIDLVQHRDTIRRELIRYGFTVLPDRRLPKSKDLLQRTIKSDIEKSNLSIHLVGEDYGKVSDGMDISVVELQNKISTEYSLSEDSKNKPHGFRRLIWIAPKLTNMTERQKIFIESLRSDTENLESAEIMQTSIHDLRTVLRNQLIYKKQASMTSQINHEDDTSGSSKVYIIVDRRDLEDSKPLAELLRKKGIEVLYTDYNKDLLELRNDHQYNLTKCDGSIIYFGRANEEWMKTKIQDILKSPGFGRNKPMRAKAIILEEGKKLSEESLKRSDSLVLNKKGSSIDEEFLKPFLERLEH
ncbi:MAG: DUF4062 domain-containing protein [Bacteroidota bacterium]